MCGNAGVSPAWWLFPFNERILLTVSLELVHDFFFAFSLVKFVL